jgi:hypothetical protein
LETRVLQGSLFFKGSVSELKFAFAAREKWLARRMILVKNCKDERVCWNESAGAGKPARCGTF